MTYRDPTPPMPPETPWRLKRKLRRLRRFFVNVRAFSTAGKYPRLRKLIRRAHLHYYRQIYCKALHLPEPVWVKGEWKEQL